MYIKVALPWNENGSICQHMEVILPFKLIDSNRYMQKYHWFLQTAQ